MKYRARLDALERRLAHSKSAALRIFFRDGSSRVTSSANAIEYFRNGSAIRAESVRGENGMLADLLTAINIDDERSTNLEESTF